MADVAAKAIQANPVRAGNVVTGDPRGGVADTDPDDNELTVTDISGANINLTAGSGARSNSESSVLVNTPSSA